ncbi:hypothetical protein CRE_15907 [Caenorhabditis remanei]|uniref:DUF38 domain-containing protein n=1 Tax=Caenorhabditis remanei TaxID=31234 RepID=E3MBG8_CAERE|nr:hypothetical protein CRE_15907 [Caenorhabditis remanei]
MKRSLSISGQLQDYSDSALKENFEQIIYDVFIDLKALAKLSRLSIENLNVNNGPTNLTLEYEPHWTDPFFHLEYYNWLGIIDTLKSPNSFLPVKSVSIKSSLLLCDNFLSILKPEVLEKIELDQGACTYEKIRMEQFKKAKIFKYTGMRYMFEENELNHLVEFDVEVKELTVDQMVVLKNVRHKVKVNVTTGRPTTTKKTKTSSSGFKSPTTPKPLKLPKMPKASKVQTGKGG